MPKSKIGDLLETQAGVAPEVVEAALGKQQKLRDEQLPAKSATSACRPTGWTR
jgi:hypothetical protein